MCVTLPIEQSPVVEDRLPQQALINDSRMFVLPNTLIFFMYDLKCHTHVQMEMNQAQIWVRIEVYNMRLILSRMCLP